MNKNRIFPLKINQIGLFLGTSDEETVKRLRREEVPVVIRNRAIRVPSEILTDWYEYRFLAGAA